MVGRRELLGGLGLLGAGGVGGWAFATDNLPPFISDPISSTTPEGPRSVGETATIGPLEITITDFATTQAATFIAGRTSEQWEAPSGAKLALFRLSITNSDIDEHEGPAFNTQNYGTIKKDPDKIYIAGVNDIRVYGDDEGAVLPDLEFQSAHERVVTYDRTLPLYPTPGAGNGPFVSPDGEVTGWAYGLIESAQTPELRVQTEGGSARWAATTTNPDRTPADKTSSPVEI
ncbi:hypothetical protein DP107_06945 [Haloglomus irregulare]|jgi:hypothetical protein|uniref:Uncharacterized protein n=1 Tax=Haloglomus irregulare TaxID=2234134 RepID=A0A554NBE2_9EURY|nr:hypothetical protein [Haloglomus irregulare]TSD14708.1 hypothetical protein DP107_06945 [Haloglomus irregulare]